MIKAALNRIIGDADTLVRSRIEAKPAGITINDFSPIQFSPSWIEDAGPGLTTSDYERWGDELPDWPGISMVRRMQIYKSSLDPSIDIRVTAADTQTTTDAGYLEYSAFFLSKHLREQREVLSGRVVSSYTIQLHTGGDSFPYPVSIGKATASNPTIEGTWEGAMIGAFKEEKWTGASGECPSGGCSPAKARSLGMGNLLTGDASVSVALGGDNGDKVSVSFTDIVDSVTGAEHGGLSWGDIPLRNGVFTYTDNLAEPRNTISGSFYGPAHLANEVGGAFERNYMVGAFGAKRQ